MSDGSSIRRPALGKPPPDGRQESPENARCTDLDGLTPDQVVERYARLVDIWVWKSRHWGVGLPKEDRAQEGYIGLLAAVEKFDPTRGVKFTTYASYWIRNKITEAAYKTVSAIRIPAYVWKSGGRPPAVTSLSAPVAGDEACTLADTVAAPTPENEVEAADEARQRRRDVDLLLDRVRHERDRHALWQRVALDVPLHQIAAPLGVCGERVRQLIRRALQHLRGEKLTLPVPKPRRRCYICCRYRLVRFYAADERTCRACCRTLSARSQSA